jgi:RNA polymerase sigma-70 factor, ECF subfamily
MSAAALDAEDVVASLYREHGTGLLGFVTRLTGGDRQLAEDVVQETLFRAWRSAVKVDASVPPVRAWLYTVARRLVVDEHRRRAARPREVGDAALEFVTRADGVEDRLRSLVIAEALASLSEPHRLVLAEIYFRGNTAKRAAEVLGLPIGTVKSRSSYALRALRLALEERGVTATGRTPS